jgi:glycosyltransferase involved in cell wall biosynthesis
MTPLISVLIPNFNHSKYLIKRIESVLNQTFKNFELIILDDCSVDDSKKIIENYRNNDLVSNIIYNDFNTGNTFMQWKKGIEISRGKYIWIAESDDYCETTFLETLIYQLESDKDISVAFTQTMCINQDETIRFITSSEKLSEIQDGNDFIIKKMLFYNTIVNASMVLFRRDVALEISQDFLSFKYCGDWLFWIKIIQNHKIFFSGKVLNYYRKHDKDVSSKFLMSGENFKEEIQLINLLMLDKIINHKKFKKIIRFKYRVFIKNLFKYEKSTIYRINNYFYNTKVVNIYLFIFYFTYVFSKKFLSKVLDLK